VRASKNLMRHLSVSAVSFPMQALQPQGNIVQYLRLGINGVSVIELNDLRVYTVRMEVEVCLWQDYRD
jgi:hypothetical protein